MTTETQTLINAVKAGEMTDPGGMTTTQDVVDVVGYSSTTVDRKLRALEREGVVESTTFGGDRVWVVPDEGDDSPDETTADRAISTTTRDPLTT